MKLAVLTTGRQDWGILRSTCLALRDQVTVLAGGMHLEPRFGNTVDAIVADGFTPVRLRWADDDDVHRQASRALQLVGEALASFDALMLVGDRFETAAAALAATVARVPIIHLHGGEETEGAFDNALRHAITKLADLHLVSHEHHAQRVVAMGEDGTNVHVVGAPALDNLRRDDLATREELEKFLGVSLTPPVVIVTMHPATLSADADAEAAAMIAAMDRVTATYVITLPNTDPGAASIRARLVDASRKPNRCAAEALGERRYFGLLRVADAMFGNSSSGIIEAPIVRLPVVNIGDRQKGRLRGGNVLDVPASADAIVDALQHALDPAFRASLPETGPFGDGRSAERIVKILETWRP